MKKSNYLKLQSNFINSYIYFINYLKENNDLLYNTYSIKIDKNKINKKMSKILLTINNNSSINNENIYKLSIILPNEMIDELINNIRELFIENNKYICSKINTNYQMEIMHSDYFYLNIKLDEEYFVNNNVEKLA